MSFDNKNERGGIDLDNTKGRAWGAGRANNAVPFKDSNESDFKIYDVEAYRPFDGSVLMEPYMTKEEALSGYPEGFVFPNALAEFQARTSKDKRLVVKKTGDGCALVKEGDVVIVRPDIFERGGITPFQFRQGLFFQLHEHGVMGFFDMTKAKG